VEAERVLVPPFEYIQPCPKVVAPVPPCPTPRVPPILESVVEATHCVPDPVVMSTYPAVPRELFLSYTLPRSESCVVEA